MVQMDSALVVQGRVLRALIFREAKTRFGRSGIGLFWECFRIGSTVLIFILIRTWTSPSVHRGMELIPFIVTGVMTLYCFRASFSHVQGAIASNRGLLQFPIVTPLDACIARWALEAGVFLFLASLATGIMVYFGLSPVPRDFLLYIGIVFVTSIFGGCCGLVFGCFIMYVPVVRHISNFIQRFLMFTSGVFFVVPELPLKMREIALYNPVLHLNEFARAAYFRVYTAEYASATYLGKWMVFTLVLGLVLERASRRRVNWIQP